MAKCYKYLLKEESEVSNSTADILFTVDLAFKYSQRHLALVI